MYDDVVDLRDFYRSSLGQATQRMLRKRIRELWPNLSGQSVLGIGYPTPFLRPFLGEAERVIACMPASQGVLRWPATGQEPNMAMLADEAELPLLDASIDRILLIHALERTEQLRAMLEEVWRVLAGSGRLLVVVPNRRGIWARLDRTPFGHGSPFSPGQLTRLLRDMRFTPAQSLGALYMPPSNSRMMLTSAPAWEELGSRWFQTFSGAVVLEATKQIYAVPTERRRKRPALVPVLAPTA